MLCAAKKKRRLGGTVAGDRSDKKLGGLAGDRASKTEAKSNKSDSSDDYKDLCSVSQCLKPKGQSSSLHSI